MTMPKFGHISGLSGKGLDIAGIIAAYGKFG